jgi:hypothetical protein
MRWTTRGQRGWDGRRTVARKQAGRHKRKGMSSAARYGKKIDDDRYLDDGGLHMGKEVSPETGTQAGLATTRFAPVPSHAIRVDDRPRAPGSPKSIAHSAFCICALSRPYQPRPRLHRNIHHQPLSTTGTAKRLLAVPTLSPFITRPCCCSNSVSDQGRPHLLSPFSPPASYPTSSRAARRSAAAYAHVFSA